MREKLQKFVAYRPKVKEPLRGVFYQLDCGQGFHTYCRHVRCNDLGYAYRFVPCPLLLGPHDDDCTEVINSVSERSEFVECEDCGTKSAFTTSTSFQVKNDIPQPFIDEHVDYYVHKQFKAKLEKREFSGLRFIPNTPYAPFETHDGFACELNSITTLWNLQRHR